MGTQMKVDSGSVKIRMYRPGFGDCFLLAFPTGDGPDDEPFYILIDCGVHHLDSERQGKMTEIAKAIRVATNNHVNLLIVTHEHADHINGFKLAKNVFDNMTIDDIWLAWTEDYDDERVKELNRKYGKYVAALSIAANRLEKSRKEAKELSDENDPEPKESLLEKNLRGALGFYDDGMVKAYADRATLGAAEFDLKAKHKNMEELKALADSEPTYCEPGGRPLTLNGLDKIRFYVLGPPLERRLIGTSDPSEDEYGEPIETYLTDQANENLNDFVQALIRQEDPKFSFDAWEEEFRQDRHPFDQRFRLTKSEVENRRENDAFFKKHYFQQEEHWRRIDDRWLSLASELALKMKNHQNNTSLVLAIELGDEGPVLLFPGDAQVGNWLGWKELSWEVDNRTVKADDLLRRVVLYKVGHHGSHNATLRELGLEKMVHEDLTALIPVDEAYAKSDCIGWNHIPYTPLLTRLKDKTKNRIIRSDKDLPDGRNRLRSVISREKWSEFLANLEEDVDKNLYYDLRIEF